MSSSLKLSGQVTLSEEQILELMKKLSEMRHDVTGRLSNVAAAAELIKVRPDMLGERLDVILQQPHLAAECITKFSRELESALGVVRK